MTTRQTSKRARAQTDVCHDTTKTARARRGFIPTNDRASLREVLANPAADPRVVLAALHRALHGHDEACSPEDIGKAIPRCYLHSSSFDTTKLATPTAFAVNATADRAGNTALMATLVDAGCYHEGDTKSRLQARAVAIIRAQPDAYLSHTNNNNDCALLCAIRSECWAVAHQLVIKLDLEAIAKVVQYRGLLLTDVANELLCHWPSGAAPFNEDQSRFLRVVTSRLIASFEHVWDRSPCHALLSHLVRVHEAYPVFDLFSIPALVRALAGVGAHHDCWTPGGVGILRGTDLAMLALLAQHGDVFADTVQFVVDSEHLGTVRARNHVFPTGSTVLMMALRGRGVITPRVLGYLLRGGGASCALDHVGPRGESAAHIAICRAIQGMSGAFDALDLLIGCGPRAFATSLRRLPGCDRLMVALCSARVCSRPAVVASIARLLPAHFGLTASMSLAASAIMHEQWVLGRRVIDHILARNPAPLPAFQPARFAKAARVVLGWMTREDRTDWTSNTVGQLLRLVVAVAPERASCVLQCVLAMAFECRRLDIATVVLGFGRDALASHTGDRASEWHDAMACIVRVVMSADLVWAHDNRDSMEALEAAVRALAPGTRPPSIAHVDRALRGEVSELVQLLARSSLACLCNVVCAHVPDGLLSKGARRALLSLSIPSIARACDGDKPGCSTAAARRLVTAK